MDNNSNAQYNTLHQLHEPKKEKGVLKGVGSVIIAIFASSHHWLHTLLIALGLTSLGTVLFSMSPWIKLVFIFISLLISVFMVWKTIGKWYHHHSVSWVYLISSIISIMNSSGNLLFFSFI